MENKITDRIEDNELTDYVGDLRRALNRELLEKKQFHKWYNQLKNLPELFDFVKNTTEI
jgi:hypothetical protein